VCSENDHDSNTPKTKKVARNRPEAAGEFCLICGRVSESESAGVTVLGRVLCFKCMETISKIDISDEEYPVIAERLKELWRPVLAEFLCSEN